MDPDRRNFLKRTGAAAGATLLGMSGITGTPEAAPLPQGLNHWSDVRAQFDLSPDYIHLAGLLLASHPAPVREAIDRYRLALNANPALYAEENRWVLEQQARRAAAGFLGAARRDIALTDSTTLGLGLVYAGVRVRADQELLTTNEDYYATHQSMRYKRRNSGAALRIIDLFGSVNKVSQDEIVESIISAVSAKTRVVGLTWVHSKTGLKIPVARIGAALDEINRNRDEDDRVLLCIDGVHGFGVEDFRVGDLRCDFFIAGAHKWLYGPRGTGIVWGNPRSQEQVNSTIPTFTPDGTWGGRMTPGGFKPFEHQWALPRAFEFHQRIGRARITARIHALNRQFKEALAVMPRVRLYTPIDDALSAGITCFDVDGLSPDEVVYRLRMKNIIASTTPYQPSHARVTPAIFNTEDEVERTLKVIRSLG